MNIIILSFLMFWQQPNITSVKVTGIKVASGHLRIAFYDSKETFLDDDRLVCGAELKVTQIGEMTISVPCHVGTYAMAVYHDVNGDGKLEMNFLGIPKEPYGFSNNVMGRLGPPSFKEASVKTSSGNPIIIEL